MQWILEVFFESHQTRLSICLSKNASEISAMFYLTSLSFFLPYWLHNSCGGKRCTLMHVIRAVTLAVVDAGFSTADREASLELIKLDISRTFPNLCIFQQVSSVNVQLVFSWENKFMWSCLSPGWSSLLQKRSRHLERKSSYRFGKFKKD